jgi:O-antigen/teichoic acid export membrane protein
LTGEEARVARGGAALYLANVTTLVLNTLFLVLLANYYAADQAEVGYVSILNVILVAATTLSVLALPLVGSGVVATPPAVTRFLSLYRETGKGSGRRVYYASLAICGAVSIVIVAVSAYSPLAGLVAGPLESRAVFFAAVDALVYSFGQLGAYAMLGSDMATSAGKLIILSSVLRYIFASALLLVGWGPSGVFIGFALGDSALALGANTKALRGLPAAAEAAASKPMLKYMLSVFLAALMGLAVTQSDKLLAFLQVGLPSLAVYNIAAVGATVASFVSSAATNVLVPALARYGKDGGEQRRILRTYTRHISLTAMPIGFELAAVSPFLLRLFGDPYASGAPVMAVISVSISLTAISAVYSSSLLVDDRAHDFTLSNVVGLAGLIAIAVVTVPTLGFFGIALGRGAMLFVTLGLTAYFVRRSGRLVLDGGAYLKALGASAIMGGFVWLVLAVVESTGAGRAVIVASSLVMTVVGLALYLLAMKLLRGFTLSDMDFIDMLLPGRLGWLSKLARKLL